VRLLGHGVADAGGMMADVAAKQRQQRTKNKELRTAAAGG